MLDREHASVDTRLPALGVLFQQLLTDARAWLAAETSVVRTKAQIAGRSAVWIAGYAIAAIIVAQAGAIALIVGSLLVLSARIGTFWATLAVTGGSLAVIAMLGLLIRWRVKALIRSVTSNKELPS